MFGINFRFLSRKKEFADLLIKVIRSAHFYQTSAPHITCVTLFIICTQVCQITGEHFPPVVYAGGLGDQNHPNRKKIVVGK